MLAETDRIKKTTFRNLVFAIVASFVYDLVFLMSASGDYSKDDSGSDGGTEKGVRSFSLKMATLSFFFRVRL
jgi:hypothetical protein